jgi:glutamine synthetase
MPARLPRDLCSALDALRQDAALREAVGAAFCDQFLVIKQAEWDAWNQHVSGWELERYADTA